MTMEPIPEVGVNWRPLIKRFPDLMTPYRSIPWTIFFSLLLIAGVVLGFVVYLNPEATIELMSDSRRAGLAAIGAFAAPVVVVGFGVIGLIWWCQRWRSPGGGTLTSAATIDFSTVDPNVVWHVLETARAEDDPQLTQLFEQIAAEPIQTTPSRFQIEVRHDLAGRYAVAIVTRHLLKKQEDPSAGIRSQLERPPVVRRDGDFIDFKKAYAPYRFKVG